MSSNFNALPSSNVLAARASAGAAAELANSLSANGGAPNGQQFADWLGQHRDGQTAPKSQTTQQATPSPLPGGNQASKAPLALSHPSTVARASPQPQAATADKPKAMTAPKQASKPAEGQANKNNAANKTTANKAADTGEAKESESAQGEGQEVAFKTAQGEGSTYVQELQPPSDLPTSDPAAMLAWLSSMAQAEAPPADAAALSGEAAAAGASEQGSDATAGRGHGRDLPGGGSGHAALALSAKDALATANLAGAEGEAAKGQSGQHEAGGGAIDFSTLMSREVGRTQQGAGGPEATRHYTGSLATPVESTQFAQALADRVGMWINGPAAGGPMTAELRLNPAEMGPVHIRIELDGQNAVVDFAAAHAQTREAIEASLPMLSSALEDVGLSLAGGGVSDQTAGQQAWAGQQQDSSQQQGRGVPWSAGSDRQVGLMAHPEVDAGRPERLVNQRAGGLDLYA